jgi:hypothetical protein
VGGAAVGQAQIVWADATHSEGTVISGGPDTRTVSTGTGGSPQRLVRDAIPNGASEARPNASSAEPKAGNPSPDQIAPAAPAAIATRAPAANSIPVTWLDALKGQKLVAADGTSLSISVSGDSIALATPPGTAVASGYLTFLNGSQGLVSEDADGEQVRGLFRIGEDSIIIDYATGANAVLSRTPSGGLAIAMSSGAASSCSVWYPDGHVFSAAEREAAVAAYASRLGVVHIGFNTSMGCAGNVPLHADSSTSQGKGSAPARATRSHHASAAKTATSSQTPEISAEPVAVRASEVHLIDGAFSVPAPEAQPAPRLESVAKIIAPTTPSQCLSVEAEGADVGFRNHCGFEVQFAYCVVDAADPARLCGAGAPVGGVAANSFGTLFAQRNPKEMEHEFRWIACGGAHGDVVPKLVRTDPPAGQCVRPRAS